MEPKEQDEQNSQPHQEHSMEIDFPPVDNMAENTGGNLCLLSDEFLLTKSTDRSVPREVDDLGMQNLTREGVAFIRKCAECSGQITETDKSFLTWEVMDFCNELCLCKYEFVVFERRHFM